MASIIHFVVLSCVAILAVAYHGADLPPGPYCGITGECCEDRQDSCAHPILDTLCYCDQHCNRTHDDCCPDYEEVCLGYRPQPVPLPKPDYIQLICQKGETKYEDCNKCTCEVNNYGAADWSCETDDCLMDDEVLSEVSQGGYWVPYNYTQFQGKKLKDGIVYKLGTFPLSAETQHMGAIRYDKEIPYPREFDARRHWPGYITPAADQGWCGSDWAVAIAGVASDRLAIQSNGAETLQLSAQTMLSCDRRDQSGCDGGNIDVAWNFVKTHGLVDEDCYPYMGAVTYCPYKRRGNLRSDGCVPKVPKRTSRYKVGPPGRLNKLEDIMYDIMESGPVHAIMTVYQDFFHYRSGIYRRSQYGNHQIHGLHSVRIIGWGEDRGIKYWIVANSWGRQWGEDGHFRILQGTNESGIESFVLSVLSEVAEA